MSNSAAPASVAGGGPRPRSREVGPLRPVHRILLSLGIGVAAGVASAVAHLETRSDFTLAMDAAAAWLGGHDPYAIRHGPFAQLYPFTAVVFAVPFVFLPWPDLWFVGLGTGLCVWAITGRDRFQYAWLALLSPAFFQIVFLSQWTALMTAAALIPPIGFLLACKPSVGAALWCAFPSRAAFVGGALFGLLSVALHPEWLWQWYEILGEATHMRPPIVFWGGALVLLALPYWRRWETRLLIAMACVPQTNFYYDTLPLWLIPQTVGQAAGLTASSWLMAFLQRAIIGTDGQASATAYLAERQVVGQLSIVFLYLPALVIVYRQSLSAAGGRWWRWRPSPAAAHPSTPSKADAPTSE